MHHTEPFDLLILGAQVIDPSSGLSERMDVGIRGTRIAAMGALSGCTAAEVVDAAGCIATPGWIDAHIHLWPLANMGVRPESACFPNCVTAALDAGSAGCATYEIHRGALLRMGIGAKALLHVSPGGLTAFRYRPEDIDPAHFDRAQTLRLLKECSDELCGLKIRMGRECARDMGIAPLAAAVELAQEGGVPLMVHATNSAAGLGEMADCLQPGDILSHPYHNRGENTMLADGAIRRVRAAQERGVWLDVGEAGGWHANFEVIRRALAEGIRPDSISTDITDRGLFRGSGAFSLPVCASKWLGLGLTLEEVIRCVTWNPARMLHMEKEWGVLAEGRTADVALLRLEEIPTRFRDGAGGELTSPVRLRPMMTVRRGQTVFRDIDLYN